MKMGVRNFVYSLVAFLCLATGGALEAQVVSITSGTLPNGAVGTPYPQFIFTATGGSDCSNEPSYSWSSIGLPSWATLTDNDDGQTATLTGTPTNPAPATFTITATNNSCDGQFASQPYTIQISSPAETYYVMDLSEPALTIYAINGGTTVTCAWGEGGPCANYNTDVGPSDLAVDQSGNFIVATGNAIVRLSPSGAPNPTVVVPLSATGEDSEFANFYSVAVDAGGNYIVADNGNHMIWSFPAGGGAGTLVGTYPGACDDFCEDVYVRIDTSGNYIVAEDGDDEGGEIQLFKFAPCIGSQMCPQEPPGILDGPLGGFVGGLTFDALGNYVMTYGGEGSALETVTPQGAISTLFSNVNYQPFGVFRDPQTGNFLITDSENEALDAISSDGTGVGQINTPVVTFSYPVTVLTIPPAAAQQPGGAASPPPFVLSGGALPNGFAYQLYSAYVSASGGTAPYTYTGTGAPAGITVSSFGSVSGTTTQTGNFSLSITATDGSGTQAAATFTLLINPAPPLAVPGGTLTSTSVQTPISQTISATGGAPPYTFSLLSGSLPTGLTLQPSGTITGVPLNAGTFGFTVRATDKTGASAVGSYFVTIMPPPLTLLSATPLASGMVTVDYPLQTITASGGVPPYQFTVTSGTIPAGLSLALDGAVTGIPTAAGTSSIIVTATDSATPPSTGTESLSITAKPFSPDLILSSGSVAFSLVAGTTVLPYPQTVQVEATDVTQTLGYTVAVSPASATWLGVSSGGGSTPGSFSISLSSSALSLAASATPYQASIVVTCTVGACAGRMQTVGVSLKVTVLPPQLTLINDTLAFDTLSSAPQPTTQTLGVENSGGGTIGFASITCGAPWCRVSGVPGAVGASATASINVTADPTGLNAGYYWTDVSIVSSAGSAIVPVTFFIAANGTLTLAPAGEEFTLPQGGDAVGDTSFLVSVTGSAAVSFSAQVLPLPSAPWLSVSPTSGTASGTQPADLNLVFNQNLVAALTPGSYYATVQIVSAGAANSPQSFEVVLNVTAPAQRTKPDPVPGGLIFLTEATTTPPAQTVTVFSSATAATNYQAAAATNSGGNWLSVSPATGTTSAAAPAQSSVSVNPSGLNPGVYNGTVSYAFSASAVRSVNVTLVVEAPAAVSTTTSQISPQGEHPAAAGGCSATQIVPTSTALVSYFAAAAAWPIELAVTLVDVCGSAIGNGQVVATFSNADPPLVLSLADAASGLYDATWTPQHTAAQVVINARATAPGLPAATDQIAGAVTPNSAPILAQNAVANFYNPVGGAPLAPGTLVQITGQFLAGQTTTDTTIPLPVTLGGTSVIIGGIQAPVSFVSPGQIDAQVPFELPAGQPYQVIVSANGALTTPESVQAGSASPGLSVLPSGYVQASHQDGTAVTDSSPAKPGEYIAVYLVGMGPTTIPVSSGAPGPGSPFANTVNAPSITLNNEATSFIFSGLIPGLVGVYQVNLQIPLDAANGDLILSFSESGINSNSGILPVHN
jgi:uncharacterized protein (TIGR03437 family)